MDTSLERIRAKIAELEAKIADPPPSSRGTLFEREGPLLIVLPTINRTMAHFRIA